MNYQDLVCSNEYVNLNATHCVFESFLCPMLSSLSLRVVAEQGGRGLSARAQGAAIFVLLHFERSSDPEFLFSCWMFDK